MLVPLGLPGLWVMLVALTVHRVTLPAGPIGTFTLLAAAVMVVMAEVAEFVVAGRYARRYGGSRRAAWGAIAGGFMGVMIGVPVPVLGSLLGAMAGAFAGAWLAEWTVPPAHRGMPVQVATGALRGRVAAAALKVAFGVAIVVLSAVRLSWP